MSASDEHKYNVVLIDYGTKKNIIRELNKRGCNVAVMPYDTKADDILSLNPDGIMLSNGPGDPKENVEAIEQLKSLSEKFLFLQYASVISFWHSAKAVTQPS